MQYALTFAALAAPALVAAHGQIKSPQPRVAGDALAKACGEQVKNQMASDPFGNIQGELQNARQGGVGPDCNLWLCKGFQFADNGANVQSYTVGQEVPIEFDVRAPHTGTANVSIVDTATNSIIGSPLITWDVYASNSAQIPKDQLSFSIKIPDLGGKCTEAGACVIQHYWDARSIDQTYESCIDFTVSGGGSGGGNAPAPAPAPSSAAPSSAAAAPSAPATTKEAVAAPSATAPAAGDDDDECDADADADDEDDDECDASPAPAPTTLVTSARPAATPAAGGSVGAASLYGQCGGKGFSGPTSCAQGTCKKMNDYYSQCVN